MELQTQLVELLIKRGLRITTAESCTGGMVASAIVDVPDASKVFEGGFVAYSNSMKAKFLNVPVRVFAEYGAVSEMTAMIMAKSAAEETEAEIAVGISGVAGPSGGSWEKPVGTVCFGFYINGNCISVTKCFENLTRNEVRVRARDFALEELIKRLEG